MSLLSLASGGCQYLVSVVDSVISLFSLILHLNNTLAAWMVSVVSAVVDGLLLLLDRLVATLSILLTDLAAFVADIGDAVSAMVDLVSSAVTETLLGVGRVVTALGAGAGAVTAAVVGLYQAVLGALVTTYTAVTGMVFIGVCSVQLIYQTVIYLLTMVPYSIVVFILHCFTLLEGVVKQVLFGCVSACGAAADGVRRALLSVVDGVRGVPPAAVLGAAILLLTLLALRRLVRLVSARGLPVERLQTAAVRLLALCRRVSTALGVRLWRRARPAADHLLNVLERGVQGASDGLRTAAAVGRLSVAVMLASVDIASRCLRTFVQNVALGLRLGVAGGAGAAPGAPLGREPLLGRREPQALRPWEPPEWEPREPRELAPEGWELERDTPPPAAAPRRRLRDKTMAGGGRSAGGPAGEPSRACVVCLDKDKSVILLPCRHVCLCEPCGRAVGAGDRRCPMCREYIQDALKVFL